jgi:dsRNA-specific ribonuclease
MQTIINLLKKLNIKYKNLNYYIEAFTHPTYLNEKQIKKYLSDKIKKKGENSPFLLFSEQ